MLQYMERALELGWGALGTTSPNPAVGCVIVRNGEVVGEGYTHPPGQWHAEADALRQAGRRAQSATLYTTLEPCNHYGRTPPCAEAIVKAGVAEVRIAVRDPNPNVAGGGIARLNAAGVETRVGECATEAGRLIEAFARHSATRLPFVTAKFAMSLDGKIAARSGDSKWISGSKSREFAHLLRAQSDAIMVGINTVLADDPQLTARDADGNANERQPLRVVLDSRGRMPPAAKMLSAPGDTLLVTASEVPGIKSVVGRHPPFVVSRSNHENPSPRSRPSTSSGRAEYAVIGGDDGRVDLRALMAMLGERDVTSVLVEGGGAVLGALFDLNLVDKVVAFVAPVIIGGKEAISPVGGVGIADMQNALRLRDVEVRRFGEDVAIIGYTSGGNDVHGNS